MKQETGCDPCDRPSITSVVGEPVYTDGLSREQVSEQRTNTWSFVWQQINSAYRWLQQITGGDFNVITAREVAAIFCWQQGCMGWGGGRAGTVEAGEHPEPAGPRLADGFREALFNFNEISQYRLISIALDKLPRNTAGVDPVI